VAVRLDRETHGDHAGGDVLRRADPDRIEGEAITSSIKNRSSSGSFVSEVTVTIPWTS